MTGYQSDREKRGGVGNPAKTNTSFFSSLLQRCGFLFGLAVSAIAFAKLSGTIIHALIMTDSIWTIGWPSWILALMSVVVFVAFFDHVTLRLQIKRMRSGLAIARRSVAIYRQRIKHWLWNLLAGKRARFALEIIGVAAATTLTVLVVVAVAVILVVRLLPSKGQLQVTQNNPEKTNPAPARPAPFAPPSTIPPAPYTPPAPEIRPSETTVPLPRSRPQRQAQRQRVKKLPLAISPDLPAAEPIPAYAEQPFAVDCVPFFAFVNWRDRNACEVLLKFPPQPAGPSLGG